jgi:hypothetical protein
MRASPLNFAVGRKRLEAARLFIQFKGGAAVLAIRQVQSIAGCTPTRRNSTAVIPSSSRCRKVIVELAAVSGLLTAVVSLWRGAAVAVPMMVAVVAGIVPVQRRALTAVNAAVGIIIVVVTAKGRHATGRRCGVGSGKVAGGRGVGVDAGDAGGVVVVRVLRVFGFLHTSGNRWVNNISQDKTTV